MVFLKKFSGLTDRRSPRKEDPFCEGIRRVAHRAREAIELPNHDGIRSALMGVSDQAIQFGTRFFCTGNTMIGVFMHQIPTASFAVFPQFCRLHIGVLS
jgi:hypothetical protein